MAGGGQDPINNYDAAAFFLQTQSLKKELMGGAKNRLFWSFFSYFRNAYSLVLIADKYGSLLLILWLGFF